MQEPPEFILEFLEGKGELAGQGKEGNHSANQARNQAIDDTEQEENNRHVSQKVHDKEVSDIGFPP
jgi:hypothetical protein